MYGYTSDPQKRFPLLDLGGKSLTLRLEPSVICTISTFSTVHDFEIKIINYIELNY